MRCCAWSLVGLLIAAGSTMAGTRSLVGLLFSVRAGAAAAGSTMAVTSAHPAGRRRLTYEYAPTADATPYCRLQNPSVCWGNTHRFLYVMANGPFEGINASLTSSPNPALGDLDGDGDLDLVVGAYDGSLTYMENTGTTTAPVFVQRTGSANPYDGINVGSWSAPALGDIDGDGDLDLVVGDWDGMLTYMENTGTSTAPAFVLRTGSANPFYGIDVGFGSAPALADLDNDGDLDLVLGNDGMLLYMENTGTSTAPVFVQMIGSANPFDGIDVGEDSNPALGDVDNDGDLDLVVGNEVWELNYIENTGTSTAPAFVQRTGGANPFDGIEAEFPALGDFDGDGSGRVRQSINCDRTFVFRAGDPDLVVDLRLVVGGDYYLDNDGDLDLVVGSSDGIFSYFANGFCYASCSGRGVCDGAANILPTCDCLAGFMGGQCDECQAGWSSGR